jgi:phage tail sheath protein FI
VTIQVSYPGVYIDEVTGPGVIAGVGTSTAAFIGPALTGPLGQAVRITSFDDFLRRYAIPQSNGTFMPFITTPHWFYLAHAVRGFFENGGSNAYVVRVGNGLIATWDIKNKHNPAEVVFRVQASNEGVAGNDLTVQVQAANATGAPGVAAATGMANVTVVNGVVVTVDNAGPFRVGDTVQRGAPTTTAVITMIQGNVLTLSATILQLAPSDTIRIADIAPATLKFRLVATTGLWPGSAVLMSGVDPTNNAITDYGVVQSVDPIGFVTIAPTPLHKTYDMSGAHPLTLVSQEFRLIVTPTGGTARTFDNLSLNPLHPGYVFSAVTSDQVTIAPPLVPPTAAAFPDSLVDTVGNVQQTVQGTNDDPGTLALADFQGGLDLLKDVQDVNILCIPDAASHNERPAIQQAMIDHCVQLRDRFAILDSVPGAPISGPGSVDLQRQQVESENGFAALYCPWLTVSDPTNRGAQAPPLLVPPSGHVAGVYARTDAERGVHKAPANTEVRGVSGLESVLSDRQQGILNPLGIDVLRIFPGTAQVTVWGARTTVRADITDWKYVSTRRLLIFIERSIEEGIRWAVFEPNNLQLWQKLKRTIGEFLTRVWRDGALFGETADKAFYVRIDEALNPPSTRALGQLYIEIGVRPSYPAEFIIVRIGLWDGGAQVLET